MLHIGGKSKLKQLKTLDWVGIFLFSTGLVVFLIGMNWGGGTYPWKSGHVLGALFAGFFTLVIFCFWEAYSGLEYPLIPMRLFRNIKYDAIVACASLASIVYYASKFHIWPLLNAHLLTIHSRYRDLAHNDRRAFHHGRNQDWLAFSKFTPLPLQLAFLTCQCAVGGGLLLGQILGGCGVRFLPRMKIQMFVASVFAVAFVAACASSNANTESRTTAFLLIGVIGAGYVENLTLSSTAYLWDPADMGLVTGVLGAIRTAIAAIATSMYSSILTTETSKYLPEYVTPAATNAGLPASSLTALFAGITAGDFSTVPGINAQITTAVAAAVKHAYSVAFRTVFLCTLPFGALLLIAALISPNVEEYLTDEVARKLHGSGEKSEPAVQKEVVDEV